MSKIVWHPSPNYGSRRNGLQPSLIVIHYTAMGSAIAARDRLCDPAFEVSAHYLISIEGQVTQLVDEKDRAWHAGAGQWNGMDDVNSRSIGIELDNSGTHPFPHGQMNQLEHLLRGIMARWAIGPEGVIGHSDMAPGRKQDPGPWFDWQRLARQGLAARGTITHAAQCDAEEFLKAAGAAGYPAKAPFEDVLAATRLRFAPWRIGPLCPEDWNLGHPALLD